jgi:hypothetical protein
VVFGHPESVDVLRIAGTGRTDEERIASALRQRVAALAGSSPTTPGQAAAVSAEGETDSIRR